MTGDQLSMLDELGRVIPSRTSDPDTSRVAERVVKIKAGTQRARLLEGFARAQWNWDSDGATDEEAMEMAVGVSATSEYAKRCSELREGGFIEPTGETRLGAAGTPRIVSRITAKGAAWIKENQS